MLANGPVRADWVTGRVRVPFGAMDDYVHSGYDSLYHNVVEFDIREGRVHRQRESVLGRAGAARPGSASRRPRAARLSRGSAEAGA